MSLRRTGMQHAMGSPPSSAGHRADLDDVLQLGKHLGQPDLSLLLQLVLLRMQGSLTGQ